MNSLVNFVFQFIEYALLGGIAAIAIVFFLSIWHPLIDNVREYFEKVIAFKLGGTEQSGMIKYASLLAFVYFMGVVVNTVSFAFTEYEHKKIIFSTSKELYELEMMKKGQSLRPNSNKQKLNADTDSIKLKKSTEVNTTKNEEIEKEKNFWKEIFSNDTLNYKCCELWFPLVKSIWNEKFDNHGNEVKQVYLLNLEHQDCWKKNDKEGYGTTFGTLITQIRLIRGARIPILFMTFIALLKLIISLYILKNFLSKRKKLDNDNYIFLNGNNKEFRGTLVNWISREIENIDKLSTEANAKSDESAEFSVSNKKEFTIQCETQEPQKIIIKILDDKGVAQKPIPTNILEKQEDEENTKDEKKKDKENTVNDKIADIIRKVIVANFVFLFLGLAIQLALNTSYCHAEAHYHQEVYKYGQDNCGKDNQAINKSFNVPVKEDDFKIKIKNDTTTTK